MTDNTPAWDGAARVRDRDGDEWVRTSNGYYVVLTGGYPADWLEDSFGPCTVVEPAPDTDEPRKTKVANCARCERIETHALGIEGLLGRRKAQLAKAKDEIDRLKARITELEDAKSEPEPDGDDIDEMVAAVLGVPYDEGDGEPKSEPGPWLRGDELKAVMPTLKAGDVVEVGYEGHTVTGELWTRDAPDLLSLWRLTVRQSSGMPGLYVDALRIIEPAPEPAPEPGADIPDEVVEAALAAIPSTAPDFTQHPVWMDCCGFAWSSEEYEYDKDSASQHTGPWTPLDTAEAWRDRIDRDKLIDLLGNEWGDPVWVADAVLAALPELMGGESDD